MSKELKQSICLRDIYGKPYASCPNLEISGRYIKSLYHLLTRMEDENDKIECQYLINKCLSKHIVYLQEAIIQSFDQKPQLPLISYSKGKKLKQIATSELSVSDGKYSLVDLEALKNLKLLSKSVILTKELVLPCKVKSPNQNYRFQADVIVTKSNVLAYAGHNYDSQSNERNVNHNTMIHRIGKGLKGHMENIKSTKR